jgi:hypothetical protein
MARGKTVFTQSAVSRILRGIKASGVTGTVIFDLKRGCVEFQIGVNKSEAAPNEWDDVLSSDEQVALETFDARRAATKPARGEADAFLQKWNAMTADERLRYQQEWAKEHEAWQAGAADRRRARGLAKLSEDQRAAVLDGPLDQMKNMPNKIRKILQTSGMMTIRAVTEKTLAELLAMGFPDERLSFLKWELARWGLDLK